MVEIPETLECLFTTSLEKQNDSYTIEIPRSELKEGSLTVGETYRVVLLEGPEYTDVIDIADINSEPA